MPNSVIPGNHDYSDITTGAATQYQQYFPVSRYAQASWNSPTAAYGGYFGQNQFGPDAADRQNMNNYATFTAGGLNFLVLNLEFDAPDDVLDWARRVLAANPARRAILVTHSFLNITASGPPTGSGPAATRPARSGPSWSRRAAAIFLVASGHFSETDIGEARRTDPNNCGQPVHQVLTDFQDRPNGGDGWLRYYTFSPARNEIRATTYSPFLNRTENDADSAFTLPYAMTTGGFVELGAADRRSGQTATVPWPDRQPNTAYEWYATVSDGTTTTTGPTWRFTTGAGGPAPAALAADGFGRTVSNGWGTAETGGAWAVSRHRVAVRGDRRRRGAHRAGRGETTSTLAGVSSTTTDTTVRLALGPIPNGPAYLTVAGRRAAAGEYGARIKTAATRRAGADGDAGRDGAGRRRAARGDPGRGRAAGGAGAGAGHVADHAARPGLEGGRPRADRVARHPHRHHRRPASARRHPAHQLPQLVGHQRPGRRALRRPAGHPGRHPALSRPPIGYQELHRLSPPRDRAFSRTPRRIRTGWTRWVSTHPSGTS